MPDRMSDEEIERIAVAIAAKKPDFYVEPEEHYNQHERLERFLDTYDSASNIVVKGIIGLVLVGVVAAMAIGSGWVPSK